MQKIKLTVSVLQEPNVPKLHVMANQYNSYDDYQKQVVQDLLNATMVTLCGLSDIWSFVGGYESMTLDAVNYIVNDQLIKDNFVGIRAIRLLGFQASPEFEQLMEETAKAQQELTLEELKAQKAAIETKKVMEEAKQTYERMAAVAKANGLEIQIKAQALKDNPFVAQYEMAKALQNWNGELSLPQTLSLIEASNKGLPIMPFMNLNGGATNGK
jgi:regulator of protease activity HflC (stomatin/prohibitin superfamily)